MNLNALVLLLGVLAAASSFVFIRESSEPPVMLAAYRLLLAALILSPVFVRDLIRVGATPLSTMFKDALLPGVVLGLHFITWIIGVRMTPATNATLIVNLVPLVMPAFMLVLYRERITRREVMATGLTLLGLCVLAAGDVSVSMAHVKGDMMCLLSMVLFAYYLALGRNSARYASIWLYIVPMYTVAGVFCFIVALFFSSPFHAYSAYDVSMIVALTLIPTIIGHTLLNYAMQKFRGQTVSVVNMSQFMIAGAIAYVLYDEIPTLAFVVASVLVFAGIWLILVGKQPPNNEHPASGN